MNLTADQKRAVERATIEVGNAVGVHGNRDVLRRVLTLAVARGKYTTNIAAIRAVEYFQLGNVEGLRVVSMNPEGVQYTVRYFRLCADK